MIELITYPLIFVFVWFTMFLIHELMHIKSQGITMGGKIWVEGWSFTCTADTVKDDLLFKLGGGILTSIICFILVFLSCCWWQWCFLTLGWVQFLYGLYEGFIGVKYRYLIYILIVTVMVIIWLVK